MIRVKKIVTIYQHDIRQKRGEGDDSSLYRNKIGGTLNAHQCLTDDEKIKYLPPIIGVSANSPDFSKAVTAYFNNISREVPYSTGLILDISMDYPDQESSKKGKDGVPVNVIDYVFWRHCLKYRAVANNPEDRSKSPHIKFYISDPDYEKDIVYKRTERNNEAKLAYFTMLKDPGMMDDVLTMYGHLADRMTEKEKVSTLAALSDPDDAKVDPNNQKIERFIKFAGDKTLQKKAFINRCLVSGVVSKIANTETIMYGETRIGISMDDAVDFLTRPNNGIVVSELENKLEAVTRGKRENAQSRVEKVAIGHDQDHPLATTGELATINDEDGNDDTDNHNLGGLEKAPPTVKHRG